MANPYPQLGAYPVIPIADLSSLTARVNVHGDTRQGGDGFGKKAGTTVLVKGATDIYTLYIAGGPLPADKWYPVSGAAAVTPA